MVSAGGAAAGLSTRDLAHMREVLAAGRKPRVVFTESAGQMAGQTGQVVALTDPALSDEFVVVRFGRDELPFSPSDLVVLVKPAPGRRARPGVAAQAAGRRAGDEQPPADPAPPVPTPRQESTVPSPSPVPSASPAEGAQHPAREAAGGAADGPRPRGGGRRPAKPKPPPSLTVTLAYADGEWTVGAQQGSRSLAKPYMVKPAEALKMVAMLDVPGVQEAVEEILASARAEAQSQAQRLREELAEVEARLAELGGSG